MIAVSDSGANIHLAKQAITAIAPVIMSNEMTERLPDGSTMKSSKIVTLHLTDLSKQARKIHIYQK